MEENKTYYEPHEIWFHAKHKVKDLDFKFQFEDVGNGWIVNPDEGCGYEIADFEITCLEDFAK